MSTLTKVFVVVLVVLSIAFTAMTISMVAQTTNWRDTAEKYRQYARVAETNLRHTHAANAASLASALDEARAQQEDISELQAQLQAVRHEADQRRSEAARATSEKSSADAINQGLLAQLQVTETARAEYRKQRDEIESRSIVLERRNIDLDARVNELTARIDVLLEQKRQYEQQINILRAQSARLSQEVGKLPTALALEAPEGVAMQDVVALTPVAARAIRGRVFDVSGPLVTITVGSADGVRKDMVFVIHRGGQYVGDVKIDLVDPNQSAGRLVRSTLTPAPGDEVTDALGLNSSRG
ncbi:MAG: hypothetical protein WBE26_11790 [Phycisphaerae bacterium]